MHTRYILYDICETIADSCNLDLPRIWDYVGVRSAKPQDQIRDLEPVQRAHVRIPGYAPALTRLVFRAGCKVPAKPTSIRIYSEESHPHGLSEGT